MGKTKCYHLFNVLPVEVREKLNIEESNFDSKKMKIEPTTNGKKGILVFWYVFCRITKKAEDGLIQKYKDKLPTSAKVEHLMDNWNLLGRCVITNKEKEDVYIGLDARKYLIRPYQHSNKFHKEKEPTSQKGWWAFRI